MTTLPAAEWTATLDNMTVALNRTLAELEHYQAAWGKFTEIPLAAVPPDLLLLSLENRLAQWDERLSASVELAASVERQLEAREAAIEQWHDVFVRWKELIERRVGVSSSSPG
jgi:hypothetical protein